MPGHDPASMNSGSWIADVETPDLIQGRNDNLFHAWGNLAAMTVKQNTNA